VPRKLGRKDAEEHTTGLFTELTLACIGEQFTHSEQVVGFVINYRKDLAKCFLWTRAMDEPTALTTGNELKKFADPSFKQHKDTNQLDYYLHAELISQPKAQVKHSIK